MKKLLCLALLCVLPANAFADEPISERFAWEGTFDFFMTGVALGADSDADNRVDISAQPATFRVQNNAVGNAGVVEAAFLYWGGKQTQPAGVCATRPDELIDFTPPGAAIATAIMADECYCSDASTNNFDQWTCRADVTALVAAQPTGDYTIDGFDAVFSNGGTDNASAALLLVHSNGNLPPRRVVLYDGLVEMVASTQMISLANITIDSTPNGDFTYYAQEGDVFGGGTEQISVNGVPGANGPILLSDGDNPADNPFNRTINTTTPRMSGVVGVDIDQFDITNALTSGDTTVDVEISAGDDKVWFNVGVLGVNLFDPVLAQLSTKTFTLQDDVNGNGDVNAGDTVRFTIHLENNGNEDGTINVTDMMPWASSVTVVDPANGTDATNGTTLLIENVMIVVGGTQDIIFDAVIGTTLDNTSIVNTAEWSVPVQGGSAGNLTSAAFVVRIDSDDDTLYDDDDNCPMTANPDQADANNNGVGDVCDTPPDMGGGPDAGEPDTGTADSGSDATNEPDASVFIDLGTAGPENNSVVVGGPSGCACGTTPVESPTWPIAIFLLGCIALRRRSASKTL